MYNLPRIIKKLENPNRPITNKVIKLVNQTSKHTKVQDQMTSLMNSIKNLKS